MLIRIAGLLVSLSLFNLACAQENENNVKGIIINSETDKPVPYVHIVKLNSSVGAISNELGEFSIKAGATDTLLISCVGFEQLKVMVEKNVINSETLKVFLTPGTTSLEPVYIKTWPASASEFKRAILDLDVTKRMTTGYVESNFEILSYTGKYGDPYTKIKMNDYDNYRAKMNGVQGFDIKGAIGLIGWLVSGGKLPGSKKHYQQMDDK